LEFQLYAERQSECSISKKAIATKVGRRRGNKITFGLRFSRRGGGKGKGFNSEEKVSNRRHGGGALTTLEF